MFWKVSTQVTAYSNCTDKIGDGARDVPERQYTVCTRALDIVNMLGQRIVCSKRTRAKNWVENILGLRIV